MAENDEFDVYNVDNYTERELFEILDIINPTDKQLEVSIYKNMEKHKNNSPLHNFFKDRSHRFFDNDDDEEVEGFDNVETTPYDNRQVTTNLRNRFGEVPTTTTNPIFNASDPKRTSREDRLNPGITSVTDPLTKFAFGLTFSMNPPDKSSNTVTSCPSFISISVT
jgi:hypothetical protein